MQSRSWFTINVIISIVALTFVIGSFTNAQQATESDSRTELNELLTRRRDTLLKRVEVLEQKQAEGRLMLNSVIAARDQLLDAELQLAKTEKKRLEIHQKRINNMRELEESVKLQHQNGLTTMESLLSATAERLQSEIDLVREKE